MTSGVNNIAMEKLENLKKIVFGLIKLTEIIFLLKL